MRVTRYSHAESSTVGPLCSGVRERPFGGSRRALAGNHQNWQSRDARDVFVDERMWVALMSLKGAGMVSLLVGQWDSFQCEAAPFAAH